MLALCKLCVGDGAAEQRCCVDCVVMRLGGSRYGFVAALKGPERDVRAHARAVKGKDRAERGAM